MDKGYSLTLDSDSLRLFFPNKPTVLNSFHNVNYTNQNSDETSEESGSMFPLSLSRGEEQTGYLTAPDENRIVVGEVDFFSDKNRLLSHDSDAKTKKNTSSIHVQKQNNFHGDFGQLSKLDVNIGLQLLTPNSGSDQSTMEDGNSSIADEKRAKIELAQMQVELERMNAENKRLRGMLHQVSNSYGALQMHIGTLMTQQQQNRAAAETTQGRHEIVEGKSEEKKHEIMVPRQQR